MQTDSGDTAFGTSLGLAFIGKPPTDSASTVIHVLAPMWICFIVGAVVGAVVVARFHALGLLGIALLLSLLICVEMKTTWTRI